jgi:hypothetical protein
MKVIYQPQILRGSRELQAWDLSHSTSTNHQMNTPSAGVLNRIHKEKILIPGLMNDAITPNMANKPRGCKDDLNARIVLRIPGVNPSQGLYPQPGKFRHEKRGLAFNPDRPNTGKLMPLSSSFFAGINNSIPQPR